MKLGFSFKFLCVNLSVLGRQVINLLIYVLIFLTDCIILLSLHIKLNIPLSSYSYVHISTYLYIHLSVCLSIPLSIHLSFYSSINLSIYLYIALSIYIFIYFLPILLSIYFDIKLSNSLTIQL